MLNDKIADNEGKAVILDNIKNLHERLDWLEVTDGLVYSADQIRVYAVATENVSEKDNAIQNLNFIIRAVNYIGRVNDWILRSEKYEKKGGSLC